MRTTVIDAMEPFLSDGAFRESETGVFANPSSTHVFGRQAHQALETARESIASSLDVTPDWVTFASGGTESNNAALVGVIARSGTPRRLLTTEMDHASVRAPSTYLREHHNIDVVRASVDSEGCVNLDHLGELLDAPTALSSINLVNSEVGTLQDIEAIAAITRARGSLLHVDAVQAIGHVPLPIPADFVSLSAHKLGGPRGIGVLLVRPGTSIAPLVHGGGQEHDRRSGTENVAGAIGMAVALSETLSQQPECSDRLWALHRRLRDGITRAWPDAIATGHTTQRSPHIVSFILPGFFSEYITQSLEERGVIASAGSACAANHQEPSPVLQAMGFSCDNARSTVRFSLSSTTTTDDIDSVIDSLPFRR